MRFSFWKNSGIMALCLLALPAVADSLNLVGIFPNMVAVQQADGKVRTIRLGQTSADGRIKLLQISGETATLLIEGQQQVVRMGQNQLGHQQREEKGLHKEILQAGEGGHFITTIQINGVSTQSMVDTGATVIALDMNSAKRMGLRLDNNKMTRISTANGVVNGWVVFLNEVRLGSIVMYQVEAVVTDTQMDITLLGMSFLKNVEMHRQNQRLELIQH